MSVSASTPPSDLPPGPLPPRPGAWQRPTETRSDTPRLPGFSLRHTLLRACHPRLTELLRTERAEFDTLSATLRPGSTIVVVGLAPRSGRSTVAALLALALAQYQNPKVLAVDAAGDGGLYQRLARWPGGSADAVLKGLGLRSEAVDDGPRQASVGYRWLRQRMALADSVMLLASDPDLGESSLDPDEYVGAVRALGRWSSAIVTDTPPLSNESVVPVAVSRADRVVVVGPDDDHGEQWVSTCLPWLESVATPPVRDRIVAVLVQHRSQTAERPAPDVGIPVFTVAYDRALGEAGLLRWADLAPPSQRTASALAAHLVRGLAVS